MDHSNVLLYHEGVDHRHHAHCLPGTLQCPVASWGCGSLSSCTLPTWTTPISSWIMRVWIIVIMHTAYMDHSNFQVHHEGVDHCYHAECPPGLLQYSGASWERGWLSSYRMPTWTTPVSRSIMRAWIIVIMHTVYLYHYNVQVHYEGVDHCHHAHCLPGPLQCPGPSWGRGFFPPPSFSTAISEHRTGSTEKEENIL